MTPLNFLTALLPLFAAFPTEVSGPILYALHRGNVEKAFQDYLNGAQELQTHDYALLSQAAKALLEEGAESKDPETRLLCMFGAGVASSSDLQFILAKGIHSADLRTQLVALSYLGKQEDDEADELLMEALSSPYLIVRLETLLLLAKRNHPAVLEHLYALSVKVPDLVRTTFGQIAAELDGEEAARYLHKLLTDPDINVRAETILAVTHASRDDLLPCLHMLSSGGSFPQQEAVALAFGAFKDQSSYGRLKEFAMSRHETVKLAAFIALYQLGEEEYAEQIAKEASEGSLFAIAALGKLHEGKETLYQLLEHKNRDVRLNAILALLNQRDRRALNYLDELLLDGKHDLGFWRLTSAGGGLKAWKTVTSASQQRKNYPGIIDQTNQLKEKILTQCVEFDEQDFLKAAHLIFSKRQHALVPLLIDLLENKKSEKVIEFLKEGHQRAGAPLIRNYCTLALYRLKVAGPYAEQLISWVKAKGGEELIRFREEEAAAPFSKPHELTPEETSLFLVEACQTLASSLRESGIELLIHTIAYGNPKNRYALAGLLLRTTE